MQVTEHELARHGHSRMMEKVRVPVGGVGVEEGGRGGRQDKLVEQHKNWYCMLGLSLERRFCIPLAFIVPRESNSEARIKAVHH